MKAKTPPPTESVLLIRSFELHMIHVTLINEFGANYQSVDTIDLVNLLLAKIRYLNFILDLRGKVSAVTTLEKTRDALMSNSELDT